MSLRRNKATIHKLLKYVGYDFFKGCSKQTIKNKYILTSSRVIYEQQENSH